jgi:hypothetical protein
MALAGHTQVRLDIPMSVSYIIVLGQFALKAIRIDPPRIETKR